MSDRVDMRSLLMRKQTVLAAQLEAADAHQHPVARGDSREYNWHAVLDGREGEGFLPARYAVSSGFVIDAKGNCSEQIDLIVHDAHFCPLFFEEAGHRYIPAESVYAVFEIRPELGRANVTYACQKADSVRRLGRTAVPITHAGGTFKPRDPFRILAGILCARSGWSEPFGQPFLDVLGEAEEAERLDFAAIPSIGAAEVTYGEEGEIDVELAEPDAALMAFLSRLFSRLQALGTVSAIDLAAYAEPLEAAD